MTNFNFWVNIPLSRVSSVKHRSLVDTLKQKMDTQHFCFPAKAFNLSFITWVRLTCTRVSQTLKALSDVNRWWGGVCQKTTGFTLHQSNSKENNTRPLNWTNQRVVPHSGRSQPC